MPIRLKQNPGVLGLTALTLAGAILASAQPNPVYAQPAAQVESSRPAAEPMPPEPVETEAIPEVSPEASIEGTPTAADTFDSYTYADIFAIGVPPGWQTTEQPSSPQVVLSLSGEDVPPAELVRTEVTWFEQPPEVVVAQVLRDLQASGYTVSRYETQGIDGTTALNIWVSNLPEDLPNAFMTYIGYADSTAGVVSYYNATDRTVESLLGDIHASFQRLEQE